MHDALMQSISYIIKLINKTVLFITQIRRFLSCETTDYRVSKLKQRRGFRADVTQQPDVPRRHQRLQQRKASRS